MKAIGYTKLGALDDVQALVDFEMERPEPTGHDLLVKVRAVSVNPVDYKVRMRRLPLLSSAGPAVLGPLRSSCCVPRRI